VSVAFGVDVVRGVRSAECGIGVGRRDVQLLVGDGYPGLLGETGTTLASTSGRELAERSSLKHVYQDDHPAGLALSFH
jgi:hypothetical protein